MLLVVLVTCRSASTSISPLSALCRKQHCSRQAAAVAHACSQSLSGERDSCESTIRRRARPHAQEKPPRLLVECWDRRRRSSSGACWGCKQSVKLQRLLPLFVIRPLAAGCWLACPSASTSPSSITPCLQRDSHPNPPRPHPRLHIPRCSARSQRPLRTAPPPPPPPTTPSPRRAHTSPLSSTRVRRRRQQREAQTACVCPRASFELTLAATAPGRVQRHWRVKSATQGTAENGYPKAIVRHREPGKGATGWDAGSLVCNNLHVQWILVQSTQQH